MPVPSDQDDVLSDSEAAALEEALEGASSELLYRTGTRIDTGRWLRKSPLWLCLTGSDLLLLAASKRRYVQRMPLTDCKDTQYSHTSGALLLAPSDAWHHNAVQLAPDKALRVLNHIERVTTTTQQPPVTEPTGA